MTRSSLQNVVGAQVQTALSLNIRVLFMIIIMVFTFLFYYFKVIAIGSSLDIFDTDKFYYNWMESIKVIPISFDSISSIYFSSLKFISAPEPVSSYLTFIVYNLFPNLTGGLYLHILNLLYITLSIFLIFKSKISPYLLLLLLISLSIGYYEFTVMHSTHRFKIAVILILVSMLIRKDYPRLSQSVLGLACLTHFSLFAMLPVLWFLGRAGFSSAPMPPFLSIAILGLAFASSIIFSEVSNDGDMEAFEDTVLIFISNKLGHAGLDIEATLYILLVVIFLMPFINRILLRIKRRIIVYLLGIYLLFALLVVGTSTLLFSFYLMLTPIFISIYSEQSVVNKRYIFIFVSIICLYSIYRGFNLAPMPLFFGIGSHL